MLIALLLVFWARGCVIGGAHFRALYEKIPFFLAPVAGMQLLFLVALDQPGQGACLPGAFCSSAFAMLLNRVHPQVVMQGAFNSSRGLLR